MFQTDIVLVCNLSKIITINYIMACSTYFTIRNFNNKILRCALLSNNVTNDAVAWCRILLKIVYFTCTDCGSLHPVGLGHHNLRWLRLYGLRRLPRPARLQLFLLCLQLWTRWQRHRCSHAANRGGLQRLSNGGQLC